jgi:hypothetical protein
MNIPFNILLMGFSFFLFEGAFMIGVPKRNGLFYKIAKDNFGLFLNYIIIGVVDCCMAIDKMISC